MGSVLLKNYCQRVVTLKGNTKTILNGIDLGFSQGEQVAIVGSSGAGKTSLLKALIFASEPSSGQVFFNELNPWLSSSVVRHKLRRLVSFVPQEPSFPLRQSVYNAVLAGCLPTTNLLTSLVSLIYPKNVDAVTEVLHKFQLSDKIANRVDQLSGGERQRVSLARALISDASFWTIDEPLSGLDPKLADTVIKTLRDHAKQKKITFVCTLHQVEFALRYFPRIVGIKEGNLAFDLPVEKVTSSLLEDTYERHVKC